MLERINSSEDLNNFKPNELAVLASEIRKEIIDTVSKNGGHLASNLGVVEITVALNKVFNAPSDRIIYDVGHQCYADKIINGRRKEFTSLREYGGISGFSSMRENAHDGFTSGHASTAISAALGCARARDIKKENGNVVAVVGDGALTGGMCYEAMNDAGRSGEKIIIVLNDNAMSISHNVGALSKSLTRARQSFLYNGIKSGTRELLEKLPVGGEIIYRLFKRVRDSIKSFFIGNKFSEALGFKYIGPVDGHDIRSLIRVFEKAKQFDVPIMIHCVTHKGYGYPPAMEKPERFHGVGPFDIRTGELLSPEGMTYGEAAAEILSDMADTREDIVAVTAAMPTGTGMRLFGERHGNRLFDVGIAEEHAVTMAAGLAVSGMKPFIAVYSAFLQRAYDQIINDVCVNRLPVTFLVDRAGLSGSDGATHNGMFDISYFRTMPNMTVCAPRDLRALKRIMRFASGYDKPLAIRYPKTAVDLGIGVDRDDEITPGHWETLIGGEIMIIASGSMVETALRCAMICLGKGLNVGVIDAVFLKPIDTELLNEIAERSKLIVTLEENTLNGGLGEAVLRALEGKSANILTLGLPDRFVAHGTVEQQRCECGLDDSGIIGSIQNCINIKEIYNN